VDGQKLINFDYRYTKENNKKWTLEVLTHTPIVATVAASPGAFSF